MKKRIGVILIGVFALLLLPAGALAASAPAFSTGRSVLVSAAPLGNAYAAGATVVVTAPITGDLTALGGSVTIAAPIAGDELVVGGSVNARGAVAGDLRAFGGSVSIAEPVGGDLSVAALRVAADARVKGSVFVLAANTTLSGGAGGPVTIYGNDVALGGDFAGDVTVISSGHLSLAPHTVIRGSFSYEAPAPARIPDSATIQGGTHYTKVSYLPSADTSHMLELMSIGFFLVVRVLGAIILAGLIAGLFPRLSHEVVSRAYTGSVRSILLTLLLGFAALVATPFLLILLVLTFVGIGLAALLAIAYALLLMLAGAYAGIIVGSALARRIWRREAVLWRDGVVGMLILSLVMLLPILGVGVFLLLTMFSAGALLLIFFRFAFAPDLPDASGMRPYDAREA